MFCQAAVCLFLAWLWHDQGYLFSVLTQYTQVLSLSKKAGPYKEGNRLHLLCRQTWRALVFKEKPPKPGPSWFLLAQALLLPPFPSYFTPLFPSPDNRDRRLLYVACLSSVIWVFACHFDQDCSCGPLLTLPFKWHQFPGNKSFTDYIRTQSHQEVWLCSSRSWGFGVASTVRGLKSLPLMLAGLWEDGKRNSQVTGWYGGVLWLNGASEVSGLGAG